jgi:hypothetical protein
VLEGRFDDFFKPRERDSEVLEEDDAGSVESDERERARVSGAELALMFREVEAVEDGREGIAYTSTAALLDALLAMTQHPSVRDWRAVVAVQGTVQRDVALPGASAMMCRVEGVCSDSRG